LRAYTNHAATALENARLFEEVQRELRERKRAEEVIRRHSEEISARNRELLDFAYTVSHDVRSPLVAIVQYARILLEEYDSRKDGKEFLGRILEQGESALAFIARLLELAKAGQITGALETVDLNCTFERISAVLRIEGRPLEIVIPSRLPLIKADSLRIEQALRNMAANAAAAAREPDGRGKDADSAGGAGQCSEPPILTVTWEDAGDHLVFTLRDNGRGIDEKDLEKIFRPGYTGARAAEFGKGFGLSIARKMIEGHGGRLWATSPGEGKGASFHFSIPYDKDAHSS
jgi:signal transduction histidine kinase